jgi:SAM-dependent methyltransferase
MGAVRAKANRFARAVREAHRDNGSRAAFRRATELVVAAIKYRAFLYSEWRFDRQHGIDTRGLTPDETVAALAAHRDGLGYEATRPRDFERLVKSLPLHSPPATYTFIDLGCGKGRVLILAAHHGFGRVVGVELDSRLVEVARANLRSIRAAANGFPDNVEVVAADAASYPLPLEPTVLYLYNPFGEQTIRDVAWNVQRSLKEKPRPLLVIYHNPVHQHLFEEMPALQRVPTHDTFQALFGSR